MAKVKICGLKTPQMVDVAIDAGASMIGLVYFSPSPRHVAITTLRELVAHVNHRAQTVVVVVNPTDDEILALSHISFDFIQIHKLPSLARLNQLKMLTNIPLIVALSIANAEDVAGIQTWSSVHDWLLFDAKAPEGSQIPGGNGVTFDWRLLRGLALPRHAQWLLSGGLTPDNVTEAVRATKAKWVDVSSGVEYEAGIKNPDAIRHFIENASCL